MKHTYYAKNHRGRKVGTELEKVLLHIISFVALFSLAAAALVGVSALLT